MDTTVFYFWQSKLHDVATHNYNLTKDQHPLVLSKNNTVLLNFNYCEAKSPKTDLSPLLKTIWFFVELWRF